MNFNVNLTKSFTAKLGGHKIQVKIVKPTHPDLSSNNESGGDHGSFKQETYTIYINKDDPESIKLSTFFHEMLHVLEDIYIINLKHNSLNEIGEAFADIMINNFSSKKR